MPGDVTWLSVGVFGKLPARGDFVRLGLPRDFVDGWDQWLSAVMATTREQAGKAWLPAFLQAPVWRFTLPAGLCGQGAAVGVTMPSVDRAGRYFPLTLAAVGKVAGFAVDAATEAWLDRCEDAGRSALEQDTRPEDVRATMVNPELTAATRPLPSTWWTDGAPGVAATCLTLDDLPAAAVYAMMLGIPPADAQLEEADLPSGPLE